jgi:hypothetical protein
VVHLTLGFRESLATAERFMSTEQCAAYLISPVAARSRASGVGRSPPRQALVIRATRVPGQHIHATTQPNPSLKRTANGGPSRCALPASAAPLSAA